MSGLREALLRMTAAGLICSAMMALAGKTPSREILRFGCACLTVILLAGVAGKADLSGLSLTEGREELSFALEEAQRHSREAQLEKARTALEDYIVSEAEKKGVECRARVTCAVEEGTVRVVSAEIVRTGGGTAGLPALQEELALALGVPRERITVREETE